MNDQNLLRSQWEELNKEHREVDLLIEKMQCESVVNQIGVQRMKKRKLLLKDQMLKIKSRMLPDIIA